MTDAVRERVEAFLRDLRSSGAYRSVRAVIVVGSAARGEEMWRGGELLSDIDVMVVTRSESLLLGREIDSVVRRHSAAGLEGGRVAVRPLRSYRTLTYYEAKHRGAVVDGDPSVLGLIPMKLPQDIPVSEAVRLLFNRLMEHVRLATKELTPDWCVAKTYAALGEAQLIAEGRYRPSFRERNEEVEREPLRSSVEAIQEKYLRSHRFRAGEPLLSTDEPAGARTDLVRLLEDLLPHQTGQPGPLAAQLRLVGRREHHPRQRLYWTAVLARQGRLHPTQLLEDPILGVWRRALAVLEGRSTELPERVLRDWKRCPQILNAHTAA